MRWKSSGVLTVTLIVCAGCGKAGSAGESAPDGIGCGAAADYEFMVWGSPDDAAYWYAIADSTPGAVATIAVLPYPARERCGTADSTLEAAVFFASGNREWGAWFGNWAILGGELSGQGWEGLAFWARAHGVTDAGVPFESDREIIIELNESVPPDLGYACATDPDAATGVIIDQTTGLPIGAVGTPACIVAFSRQLTVTEDWRLYLVPWLSLAQNVNGSPRSGVNGPTITEIHFRAPRGALLELWLDDLGLYRARPAQ